MPGLSTHYWPELGLELADARDVSARKGIQLPSGVYIVRINAGSPSGMAGLKSGNIIVELENRSIRTLQDIWPIQKRVWQAIMADLQRDGEIDLRIALRIWQSDQIIPIIDETLENKFSETFQARLTPGRKSVLYQIGLSLVAVAMVLLPFTYILLIIGTGYGIYYYATNEAVEQYVMLSLSGLPEQAQKNFSMIPFVILFIQILFLAIPLVAPLVKSLRIYVIKSQFLSALYQTIPIYYNPLYSLYSPEEPLLYFFVEQICKSINAPVPKRIDLTIEPNAYASFRKGFFSFFSKDDLVLELGLPLVSTLSIQQLGGIIAHELGHFSQNYGLRLSFIIRSINGWFRSAIYERTSFDEGLIEWGKGGWLPKVASYLCRLYIWITRRILWILMMLGRIISRFTSHQMEFDADRYEIRVAGSKTFEANVYALRVLQFVHYRLCYSMLMTTWSDKLLVTSLTDLIQYKVNKISTETLEEIKQETLKTQTKIFDTHPSDKERIIIARNLNEEGILHLDQPSSTLFSNFENLVQDVTYRFYQNEFGDEVKHARFLPLHEYLEHYSSNQEKYQNI